MTEEKNLDELGLTPYQRRYLEHKKKEMILQIDENIRDLFPQVFNPLEEIQKLLNWTPSCFELDKNSDMYEEGDEKAPFFSEAFLYNLLGKEDARTLLCLFKNLLEKIGYDYYRDNMISKVPLKDEIEKEEDEEEFGQDW